MIFSVSFRVRAENEVNQFLQIMDKKLVFLFCNKIYDEYIIQDPVTDLQIKNLEKYFAREVRVMNPNGNIIYLYIKCDNEDPNHLLIAKDTALRFKSIMVSTFQVNQWQHYTVLIFGSENLKKLHEELILKHEFEFISQKEVPLLDFTSFNPFVEIKHILETTTEGQLAILKQCIEDDYYSIPRKKYLQDIAVEQNKSRSSIEKMFRSVENRVMDVVIPQLYFYLSDIKNKSTSP